MRKSVLLLLLSGTLCLNNAFAQSKKDAAPKPSNADQVKKAPQKTVPPDKGAPAGTGTVKTAPAVGETALLATPDTEEKAQVRLHQNHKLLHSTAGTWKAIISVNSAPGFEPVSGVAACEITMQHGNRFSVAAFSGNIGESEYSATLTLGYDIASGMFVSTWMDNTSTDILVCKGKLDEKRMVITLNGSFTNAETGKPAEARLEYYIGSDDKHKLESFVTYSGQKEFKNKEITFGR